MYPLYSVTCTCTYHIIQHREWSVPSHVSYTRYVCLVRYSSITPVYSLSALIFISTRLTVVLKLSVHDVMCLQSAYSNHKDYTVAVSCVQCVIFMLQIKPRNGLEHYSEFCIIFGSSLSQILDTPLEWVHVATVFIQVM